MPFTTAALLAAVRRSAFLPDAHDVSDADMLAFGDEELSSTFAEILRSSREEYRVRTLDVPLLAGVTRYRAPRRALAGTVRGVTYLDAQGNESPAQELPALEAWRWATMATSTSCALYTWEADEIVLRAAPTQAGESLRIRYIVRFPRMIVEADAQRIVAAVTPTQITVDGEPPSSALDTGALVDIIRGDSPFLSSYEDLTISLNTGGLAVVSPAVTVADISDSSIPGARADWLCPRDCTVYPPLPQEMHGVLALAIVRRVLESLGDPAVSTVESTLRQRLDRATNTINPRDQNGGPRIIPHGGRLRGGNRHAAWRRR